jgi:CheY-like chemotaxis protein
VMDITDRIELENDLHEAKKIAEKNAKMKDLFLSNMSHEIRTPMNAITGFGRLLASTKLDNEQAEYTNSINIASTNLLNIINDILDFSKIESGQIVMEHIKFSLKEQIQNVRKILTFNAQIKNLEFKYYFDEKLPDMVMGDPTRLNQVMVNLLNNAIKFTEEGFVELRVEVVKKLENKTEVKFEINDSGIGIAPDKLEVIFDRFTQANTNTTRKYGGTGLGLSISKSLAELLGGELIVASEEGKGSTFSFNLLFENPMEAEESEIKLVEPETGLYDTKILLVEDNLLNQKLALRVLQKRGFLADLAENGAEAVEILKTKTYDLILMDLQMPEMDGYQATTYIRNEMKLQTPIIAMTAHSIVGEKAKCLDIGMNDYLPKPFDPNLLHSKILEYTKKDNNDN